MSKVNILGAEYDFNMTTAKDDSGLCGKDGYCDRFAKIIAIETDYNANDQEAIKNFDSLTRKVIRHEIIHAYFAESGLSEYTENEQLVDWIAWQFPKLFTTFKEVDAL